MVESEDGVAYQRDSSFVMPYHPQADGTLTADIALENQEVETRKVETRDARPSCIIRFPERDSKTLSWTSQSELLNGDV